MDGRRSLFLTAGFLGSLSGCATWGSRQTNGMPTAAATPMPQTQTMPMSQSVATAPLTPHPGKLQASTHVTMGALAEQIADDMNRSASEREQFRAKARQSYQKAIETDPKCGPAYLALAASYAVTNDREQASANFAKAVKLAPNDAGVWAAQGSFYARIKEWDAAIESLSRAVQLEPENKEHQKKLGFALARAGRVDEGYAVLAKCMSEAEARYNVARMLQHLEQPMACRWYLQMALQADPNYEPAREALAALTTDSAGVRPVADNESTPAPQTAPATQAVSQTAPAVQTAAYTEPAATPAQAAPANQPIVVVNGANAASTQPVIVVNGPSTTPAAPPTQPVIVSNRPTATAAAAAPSGDLPRLPPVILGSRETPAAPIKVGVSGIEE
jgi:Flp pilus assembly protein TadD